MAFLRHSVLLLVCWQLCHGSLHAQANRNSRRAEGRSRHRVAKPVIEDEQLVRLVTSLERIRDLSSRQRDLDLQIGGVSGFLWLTMIELPAINASHGFVSTRGEALRAEMSPTPSTATEALKQLEKTFEGQQVHPLKPWVQYAGDRYQHVRRNVRDHTCVLIKRERIDGMLSGYQYLVAKSRYQQVRNERVVVPLSVFLHYAAPARLRGRKVVYVAGRDDNKMLVRNGGRRFGYVTVKIDPNSQAALRESHYPITELGMDNVIKRLLEKARQDMSADDDGTNTTVEYFEGAKINDRACVRVRVIHPRRHEGLNFHRAEIYVDDQLQVPIRIEAYDWPKDDGQEAALIEEFTYSDLKFNVGLKSADFLPRVLE